MTRASTKKAGKTQKIKNKREGQEEERRGGDSRESEGEERRREGRVKSLVSPTRVAGGGGVWSGGL